MTDLGAALELGVFEFGVGADMDTRLKTAAAPNMRVRAHVAPVAQLAVGDPRTFYRHPAREFRVHQTASRFHPAILADHRVPAQINPAFNDRIPADLYAFLDFNCRGLGEAYPVLLVRLDPALGQDAVGQGPLAPVIDA